MEIAYSCYPAFHIVEATNKQVAWLRFASHRQGGHLEMTPPFTVPYEGREARFLHRSHRESNPGPSRGSPLRYRHASSTQK